VSGYPGAGNKGFHTVEECINAWQTMCPLGVHPHPVEPTTPLPVEPTVPVKVEEPRSSPRTALPPRSPRTAARGVKDEDGDTPDAASPRSGTHVNFAIRGHGVISSSP
jgi:hypothetical protein